MDLPIGIVSPTKGIHMTKPTAYVLGAAILIVGCGGVASVTTGQTSVVSEKIVDASGNLRVPSDYRTAFQYLGTWGVAADKEGEGSKQLHNVYVSPGSIQRFRESGEFADGTVLVKEVFATRNDQMTTGLVSHADALQGWFVMVKARNNIHPENKLWANGWIWSWFDADKPTKTTSTDFSKDCQSCHEPAKATDWVYSSGYPALKR
jgi:hypothetical protein